MQHTASYTHTHTHTHTQASVKGSGVEMKECVGLLRQAVNEDVGLFSHGTASLADSNTHQTHSADCSILTGMAWIVCVYAGRMGRMCGMYID